MRRLFITAICLLMTLTGWGEELPPDKVTLNGQSYRLDTYMWRDSMPPSPAGGKPLIASVTLKAAGHESSSPEVTWKSLTLFQNGKKVWHTELESESERGIARGGPNLKPGSKVRAVVTIIDSNGKTWLLRADEQEIQQTW